MHQQRLHESEQRNEGILKELNILRKELDQFRVEDNKLQKETLDQKEQIRTLNDNLRRESDISKARESEARVFGQENRNLKKGLEDGKEDHALYKADQNRLISNLRLRLEETKEIIDKLKETKEKEQKRLRDKFDEERRKETEKY